jgi:hypothetical protein
MLANRRMLAALPYLYADLMVCLEAVLGLQATARCTVDLQQSELLIL